MSELNFNTSSDLPSEPDLLALSNEYMSLAKDLERSNTLEKEAKNRELTKDEADFLSRIPQKMRRAVEITRILRKTHTGPAKVKATRRSKKAVAAENLDKLLKELE